MAPDGPVLRVSWLAHHRADELHRCLLLPWGARRLAVCARCLAFYPALLATLALHIAFSVRGAGSWDFTILIGVAPMLVDWGIARLRWARGSNRSRIATGAMAGIALGRGFQLYFRDPGNEAFWVTVALVVISFAAVEIVRALRLGELPGG